MHLIRFGKCLKLYLIAFVLSCPFILLAQDGRRDSMMKMLQSAEGTKKADISNSLSKHYWTLNYDSSVFFANKALGISKEQRYALGEAEAYRNLGVTSVYKFANVSQTKPFLDSALNLFKLSRDKKGMADTYNNLGSMWMRSHNYAFSLTFYDSSLSLFRDIGFKKGEAAVLNYMGIAYQEMGDFHKAIDYTLKGVEVRKTTDDYSGTVFSLINTGNMFLNGGQSDIAMKYYKESIEYARQHHMEAFPYSLDQVGNTFLRLKQYDSAKIYLLRPGSYKTLLKGQFFYETGMMDSAAKQFETNLIASEGSGDYSQLAASLNWMSKIYLQKNQPALALQYATKAFFIADSAQIKMLKSDAAATLSQLYENSGNYKSSLYYFKLTHSILDSVANGNYQNKLAYFESKTEIEKGQNDIKILSAQKALQQQTLKQERLYKNSILIAALIIILAAFFIIRNINGKKKRIQLQKDQIAFQKKQVEVSLEELKSTQAQLIQREKMASLGELTAGIAHEIQNPLNFVNNFSEVNKEMVAEMNEEIDKGNYDGAKLIAKDIKQNEEKINHHGKRAGEIVKGMLQHSRTSTGIKEPTDINALCDEYLRLSYHGMRAKDKNFNATLQTDFDDSIGKINIVPQDIGRVLLNLYNNAFYACAERSRSAVNEKKNASTSLPAGQAGSAGQSENYEPTVSVSIKKMGDKVSISVKDNGNGIPQNIIDKIFQPFFTTKPTGQGTGLGLSLSYDIIKAHGGEIKVKTKEGEGSEFIIQLSIK